MDEQETRDLIDEEHPSLKELCKAMQEDIRRAGAIPWQKRR